MEQGWSLKWLQREIVLSEAYGQSSDVDRAESVGRSGEPLDLAGPRRRLGIEAYRDSLLFVSGRLDDRVGGQVDST